MPSSAVRTFTDSDDYAATIRTTKAEMTVTERGRFTAKIIRIDLHRLWMQRFSDNLPRVAHSAAMRGRAVFSFRTQAGPSLLWGGAEMHPTNIVRHTEGESTFQRSSGSASWGAMSLPMESGGCRGNVGWIRRDAAAQCDADHPSPLCDGETSAAARGGRDLAENAPEIIANPDAARGLEQALIEAMVGCLAYRAE